MAIKVETTGDIEQRAKWLIYGPPGVGKTQWVAQNVPNPIWYDAERSADTLKAIGLNDIPVVRVTPRVEPDELVRHILSTSRKSDYETIVLDTISSLQLYQLKKWMEGVSNRDDPLFQDYRRSTTLFSELFLELQHSNINIVLIAHEREITEKKMDDRGQPYDKVVGIGPDITPAISKAVKQLVSGVFRLQESKSSQSKTGRSMIVRTKQLYQAKNRSGISDQEVIDPTWETFMQMSTERKL